MAQNLKEDFPNQIIQAKVEDDWVTVKITWWLEEIKLKDAMTLPSF